jgi:hypothetical protein
MLRLAAEFGMTAVARSRLKALDEIGTGKFEGLLGGYPRPN